ncbi:MAG: T9SS type A sorting domain-containing protein [Bacteroidetes bacterium]|nr:T9SS type A sorting domain-containing protein [Bacteroidota bacterium]
MNSTVCYILVVILSPLCFNHFVSGQSQINSPGINLGPDFNLCTGFIHLLDAGPGYDSYLWQDGSTDQTYMVTEGGTFWVHAYVGSVMYADTIHIGYWPYPDPNLGNDTLLCPDHSIILEPPVYFTSYLWQDGSTLPFYVVSDEGLYWVDVTDVHGCTGSDSIFVEYSDFEIDLGENISICLCDSVLLDAGDGFFNYEWQDGSTGQYFLVVGTDYGVGSHEFSVTALDSNNCETSDTILIYIAGYTEIPPISDNKIRIYPNPADDFLIINFGEAGTSIYTVEIFDMHGNKIYQCDNLNNSSAESVNLETDHFKPGIHMMNIQSSSCVWNRKLVISH